MFYDLKEHIICNKAKQILSGYMHPFSSYMAFSESYLIPLNSSSVFLSSRWCKVVFWSDVLFVTEVHIILQVGKTRIEIETGAEIRNVRKTEIGSVVDRTGMTEVGKLQQRQDWKNPFQLFQKRWVFVYGSYLENKFASVIVQVNTPVCCKMVTQKKLVLIWRKTYFSINNLI